MNVTPIAYVRNDFKQKFGVPRQSGRTCATSVIEFVPPYNVSKSLRGIDEFNYLWILFDFSLSHRADFSPTVRPPRLGGNTRVGVFASRSPFRPNSIGLSSVKLLEVKRTDTGCALVVSGLDVTDGTPVYDVKPYVPYSDCHTDATGSYADYNQNYALTVDISDELLNVIAPSKQQALIQCLQDDPRPSYQDDNRTYSMRYACYDVHFTVDGNTLTVRSVDIIKE